MFNCCILVSFLLFHHVHAVKQLNVLFLVIDDLRPTLGSYDFPKILSPNIDNLAALSVQFNNAHVQQTVCGPSRTSFLTSRRPDTTRLYDFGSYWRTQAGNYTTLPQHFKQSGYYTYSIGKVFHPGICSNFSDDYPYSWSAKAYHPPTEKFAMAKVCPGLNGKLQMNLLCAVNVSTQPGCSLPDIQSSNHAVEMLKSLSLKDQPFFLAVGFHKPHIPFKFPEEYLKLYPLSDIDLAPNPTIPKEMPLVAYSSWPRLTLREDVKALNLSFPFGPIPREFQRKIRQHYFSSVTYIDAMVGKLLRQLEESGLANNTIISLIGDHGWSLGEHGDWCKYENFEVVTRVPLLVYVPGLTDINFQKTGHKNKFPYFIAKDMKDSKKKTREGFQSKMLVEAVDLFPTLSELAGLQVPPICPERPFKVDFCTEGSSFVPLLKNAAINMGHGSESTDIKWKSAAFSQYPRPSVFPQMNSDLPSLKDIRIMGYTMRTQKYRYTEWVHFNHTTFKANYSQVYAKELYLRESDPLEIYNVANFTTYSSLIARLHKNLLAGWRQALPLPK